MEKPFETRSSPPHMIWWALLDQRVNEAKLLLPRGLVGRIRFNVEMADLRTAVLTIDVNGPKTALYIADRPGDTDVETSDAMIERMLVDKTPPKDVFRVSGNSDLFRQFFHHLSSAVQPSSWLDMQVKK